MANISNAAAGAHNPTQAQGAPTGLGHLGRLPQRVRNTIYKMVLIPETPIELTVEMGIYGERYITIAQPALLRVSSAIYKDAVEIFYHHNKFFVIVDGPSNTGKNLQDLQHGVDALLRLLNSRRARHLDLVVQDNRMHGDMWHNLDSASVMKLADLAARRSVQVTINNRTIPVLGAAGHVADLPTINIAIPGQQIHVIQMLTVIFIASAGHQAMPVRGGLHQFIESRLRAIPPSAQPRTHPSRFKLPHGLNVQTTPWYTLPDQESQELNMAQDMANLDLREAQLGWFRIILRSLGTHRNNLQMEITNLAGAQGGSSPICFIGVGEGFGCYIRTWTTTLTSSNL